MTVATQRLDFTPPAAGGLGRPLVLAVLAHLLLVAALTLGVQWRRSAATIEVQAELWAAVPQAAAPKRVEARPPAPPPRPPKPAPAAARPPPAPTADAQIALERDKQRREKEKQLAVQQREQEKRVLEKKREQEREAALEKKREQEQREKEKLVAVKKKQEQDKQAQEKTQRELDEAGKRAAEKQRLAEQKAEQDAMQVREEAQMAQQETVKLEAQRQVNLARMAGLAGASGAPGSTGTAQKASGGSSSYGGRVSAIVKPNIVFTEDPPDNPIALVEVRAAPDGTIIRRRLVRSSGNKAWDEAVLKAIDKTAVLPRDIDGTVPPVLEINFRRRD